MRGDQHHQEKGDKNLKAYQRTNSQEGQLQRLFAVINSCVVHVPTNHVCIRVKY